ncbi:MAG: acetyl-CoA carboxylase biotin carboxylase subunit [Bacteroidota bacterium]|nr:acetyl-CoA carboxylase biotin carboxylase subunit [Bacteroidota bacterium]
MKLFNKILIANRSEIAVRIIKSAKKLGIKTVSIYSEVDTDSLHINLADEAYCIGKIDLNETYLNIDKIIAVAKKSNCDAIHPGYGFLSENPLFVKACEKAGITFIGPSSDTLEIMGNKIKAREFIKSINVPINEGITGDTKELLKASKTIPFPLLIKAAAGGGGKGMRIVHNDNELVESIESTQREAKSYFGDETVFIEKYIEEPRHIEVQIIGDNFGNVIHLFERECSIQRRYQKIIEEAPSPTLTDKVRKEMCNSAVKIAEKIKYNNAGTIEFLVDKDLNYYFLEMNTRIQVEHPVTELTTGVDIVKEQILIAAGNKLSLEQKNINQNGHAIECRVYAEDPATNFLPSPGKMLLYKEPKGKNIRIDTGIDKNTEIKSFFDPMISKLIVWGEDRNQAIKLMSDALKDYIIHGIKTNIAYLIKVINHKIFIKNNISTKFCDEYTETIINDINKDKKNTPSYIPTIALLLYKLNTNSSNTATNLDYNVWKIIGYWRDIMSANIELEEKSFEIKINSISKKFYEFEISEEKFNCNLISIDDNGKCKFIINENYYVSYISEDEKGNSFVNINDIIFKVKRTDILSDDSTSPISAENLGEDGNKIKSPMPGKIIKINVKKNEKVKKGEVLLVIESMKMENNIESRIDGTVKEIKVSLNDMVTSEQELLKLE